YPVRYSLYPGQGVDEPLSHYYDPDGDLVHVEITTPPLHGTLSANGTNINYSIEPQFEGINSAIYQVVDSGNARSAHQTLYFHHSVENLIERYVDFDLRVLEAGSFISVPLPAQNPLSGGNYDLHTQQQYEVSYQLI